MADVAIAFVPAVLKFEDGEWDGDRLLRRDLPAGSACWVLDMRDEIAVLDFVCPCGCGTVGNLSIRDVSDHSPSWIWNGDQARPTMRPSIQMTSPCRWHGYLTDGVFRSV